MSNSDAIRLGAMWLAVLGTVSPSTSLGAPPSIGHPPPAMQSVRDVALGQGGTLSGRLLDSQRKAISNVSVRIYQDSRLVAHAVTDTRGQFSARQLAGGVYSISALNQQDTLRIWPADAAPPIAARTIEMIDGQIVRGQCASCGFSSRCAGCRVGRPWLIALGIATAIALPLALDDDDGS